MKSYDFLKEFLNEIVIGFLGVAIIAFKDFLKKHFLRFYERVIRSRFTPKRLSYQEEDAMKLGIITSIRETKSKIYADSIYIFSIYKNGTDTLKQHLRADDRSELDGVGVGGMEELIEDIKEKGYISILDTSNHSKYRKTCQLFETMGYKSVDFILLDNKYRFAFFMVIHKKDRFTAKEDVEYLKRALLRWRDPVSYLYLRIK